MLNLMFDKVGLVQEKQPVTKNANKKIKKSQFERTWPQTEPFRCIELHKGWTCIKV